MKQIINGIIYSISYFTILPIKLKHFEADKEFYKGVVWGLPIVGILLALITIITFKILPFEPIYSAFLSAVFYLFLYGFIHLEAISDVGDGWFASFSNKDVYKVMKEPQIGAMGAILVFCFVLLKVAAISYLLYLEGFAFILFAFAVSRFSLYFALSFDFHPKSGFLNLLKNSSAQSSIIKLLFFPLDFATRFLLKVLRKRLGFLNGDTIGFGIELLEIIALNIGIALC